MVPFRLQYTLTRRQLLAVELYPWLPAMAGTIGFSIGAAFLALAASVWFLLMLLIPVVAYRGLFAFLWSIATGANLPIDLVVEEARFGILSNGRRRWLPLEDIIQVYRSEDASTWTVLHMDGTVLMIPPGVIAADQLEYLKSFALRGARERRMARSGH